MAIGKEMQPLIQWSPNGIHWLEWKTMVESERLDVKAGKVLGDYRNLTEVERLVIETESTFTSGYEKALNEYNNFTKGEYLALHSDFKKYQKALLDPGCTSGHPKAPLVRSSQLGD